MPRSNSLEYRKLTLKPGESICDRCDIVCGTGYEYRIHHIRGKNLCDACRREKPIDYVDGIKEMMLATTRTVVTDRQNGRKAPVSEQLITLLTMVTNVRGKDIREALAAM